MGNINETIALTAKDGLEIEFSRIVYVDGVADSPVKPSWVTAHLPAAEIEKNLGKLTFTEDELEAYLKSWLEYTLNCGVKTFRWVWDKYRNYKAA